MQKNIDENEQWDLVIESKSSLLDVSWRDIWSYRDLLLMFVKRDVIVVYKQTVLGPIWYIAQPILTTIVYMFIFGKIANISTDGLPGILFYFSGIVVWNFFADSFNQTSGTFTQNAAIFGKVYFPRLITPLSKVISSFIKFTIQFVFFLCILFYYLWVGTEGLSPNSHLFFLPLYVLMMAGYGLGFGIIFTSLVTKYRDFTFLIAFGVQLVMYATPIIYPVSSVPDKYVTFIKANPLTSIVEGFRYGLMGTGQIDWTNLIYSLIFLVVLVLVGVVIFNRTEKSFIDTV